MTAPDFIKAWPWNGQIFAGQWHVDGQGDTTPYVRRDPAVLAELPEVKAMLQDARNKALRDAAALAGEEGWDYVPRIGTSEREEGSMNCADRIADAIIALIQEPKP